MLRHLDDAGFDLADIDELYLADWQWTGLGLPPFSARHDAQSFGLPDQVPARLRLDPNQWTWKLIREHQLAR